MVAFSNALNLTGMKWRESPCTTIPRFQVPSTADSSIGFSLFTRRYSGNHSCFLVLRSMICLSSAGYPTSWRWLIKSFVVDLAGSSFLTATSHTRSLGMIFDSTPFEEGGKRRVKRYPTRKGLYIYIFLRRGIYIYITLASLFHTRGVPSSAGP